MNDMNRLKYILAAAVILMIGCEPKENKEAEAQRKAELEKAQVRGDSIALLNADYLEGNPAPR